MHATDARTYSTITHDVANSAFGNPPRGCGREAIVAGSRLA